MLMWTVCVLIMRWPAQVLAACGFLCHVLNMFHTCCTQATQEAADADEGTVLRTDEMVALMNERQKARAALVQELRAASAAEFARLASMRAEMEDTHSRARQDMAEWADMNQAESEQLAGLGNQVSELAQQQQRLARHRYILPLPCMHHCPACLAGMARCVPSRVIHQL